MSGALTIRRLSLAALAPRDHPEPEGQRSRITDAVRGSLPTALADALGDWYGEGVLRIRRLEVDLTVDATLPLDRLTARLANTIADGLRRARADRERVLTFPDGSHFLAAFLRELASGQAWQRWWFRSFDGLRLLPVSAGIRTAVLANPAEGLSALLAMPPSALDDVLAKLGASESARVLDGLAGLGAADLAAERIVAALVAARTEMVVTSSSALAIFLAAARTSPECAGPQLAAMARALATLDAILAERTLDAAAKLLHEIARNAGVAAEGTAAASLAPLQTLAPELRRALLATAAGRRGIGSAIRPAAQRRTAFGGLFLLLPSLDLPAIEAALADLPAPDSLATAPLVGLATLAACAGRREAAEVVADPVWREVFGLPPSFGAADIAAALASLPAATWRALDDLGEPIATRADARFLLPTRASAGGRAAARTGAQLARATFSRFARRLPGFANSSPGFLYRNILAVSAGVERTLDGFSVVLDRPPLDVLLSISGIADATVIGPHGFNICLRRRRLA